MDMSTLIKTEHDNWKKRMMVETCGTYILMNMGMGFVVIAGAFCGVMNTEFDLYYYNMVVFFTFGLYYAQSRYITYIWENGRKVNIFEKYIYLPVDLKKLRKAKLIVVGKNIMIPVILGQLSAILMRGTYYGWHVKSWLDLGLYTPVMVGIGFLIFKEAEHRWLCFKAVKN